MLVDPCQLRGVRARGGRLDEKSEYGEAAAATTRIMLVACQMSLLASRMSFEWPLDNVSFSTSQDPSLRFGPGPASTSARS